MYPIYAMCVNAKFHTQNYLIQNMCENNDLNVIHICYDSLRSPRKYI